MFTIIGADQKHYGPVTADEVRLWIKDGRADGRTLARAEGETDWKPLSTIPEFAAVTAAAGTPPRLPSTPPALPKPAAEFVDEQRDLDIGACLGHGWALWMQNVGLLATATFLIWLIDLVVSAIPFAGAFISGILYGGLYLVFLKRIRGRDTTIREAFSGFGPFAIQLLLTGFLTSLLQSLAYFACILPWVYFKIAWTFALPLVIDKRLEFWTAMEVSRKVASRVWLQLFVLTVVAFAPYILCQGIVGIKIMNLLYTQAYPLWSSGAPDFAKLFQVMKDVATSTQQLQFAAQVVLLLNLPFAVASQMQAYEALFGTRPAPAA